jgi:SAM-dependent methyltransferase
MDEVAFESGLSQLLEASSSLRPEFQGRYFRWAILNEDTETTNFDTHYLYHVAWAIRKVAAAKPRKHIDFSSSVNFCTTVSALCETEFYDIRPAPIVLDGLACLKADLTQLQIATDTLDSVSCMHVVEHVGLGRYGDTLDACGDLQAIKELKRVVRPGGVLYFVAPTGNPGIYFNAHRVYAAKSILGYFEDQFDLEEFYFIPGPIELAPMLNPELAETLNYEYGCGCYQFRKR